jgi:uncharacterized Rmd1/YagE family protein
MGDSPSDRFNDLRTKLLESGSGLERTDSAPAQHAKYLSGIDTSPLRKSISVAPERIGLEALAALPALPAAATGSKQKRRRNIPTSRQVPRPERVGPSTGTVLALALGESIDIAYIEAQWTEHREAGVLSPEAEMLFKSVESVISIEKQVSYWKIFEEGFDCFVFGFGCVVCWDPSEQQLETLQSLLMPFVGKSIKEPMKDRVVYTSAASRIEHEAAHAAPGSDVETSDIRLKPKIVYGNIQMTSVNSFEKLAYSYSLAQSVRLDVFEADIEEAISASSQIPVHLAKAGSVGLSNRAVTIKMGELFLQRSNVNLHSDILDTPELFWEFDEYEQMYILGRSYLDIDKRITILNQRLDIMKDLYEMLQNELNVKHSAKIEIIIIVLILAEIVLQVMGMVISWLTGVQVFER